MYHKENTKEFAYFLNKVHKKLKVAYESGVKINYSAQAIQNFKKLQHNLINIWQKTTILEVMIDVQTKNQRNRVSDLDIIAEAIYEDIIIRISSFFERKVQSEENKNSKKLSIFYFIKAIKYSGNEQNYKFIVERMIKSINKYKLIWDIKVERDQMVAHSYVGEVKMREMREIKEIQRLVKFTCGMMNFIKNLIQIPDEQLEVPGFFFCRDKKILEKLKDILWQIDQLVQ